MTRRVPEGLNRRDAGYHIAARLDEGCLVGERHQVVVHRLCPAGHVLVAALQMLLLGPEIIFGIADDVARVGIDGLATFHKSADVVGMAMGDDDNVDLVRLETGGCERRGGLAGALVAPLLAIS